MMKLRVLELNASDERGINVVREKVKKFAQTTASGTRPDGKPCPPFKIIILDEADSMTAPAQAALRRTMEKESKSTRFCLICNYVSRIIEPIASRCAKFRFKPLADSVLSERLQMICDTEKITCDKESIQALMDTSEGDMRKAITYFQSAGRLKGEEGVTKADIYEIAGVIDNETIDQLIQVCRSNSYEKLEKIVQEVMYEGHSAAQIINQLHDKIVQLDDLNDQQKSIICEKLALPNLLFYGPPGTGKTSTILAAARSLFGTEMMKLRVLELNASDERGINVVREKVKKFAQTTASGTRPDGKPCPPFKIIILDEADSMTAPAQAALRRTMEKESKSTRFCLICNYVSRIIEPIASRCAKFRFKPLADSVLSERLQMICDTEKITCDKESIQALMDTSEGDMRKAITYLQSAGRLKGEEGVTKADIYEIAGVIDNETIDQLIQVCRSNSYEKLEKIVQEVMYEGHSAAQIINQLHDKIVQLDDLNDQQKSIICEKLAVVDKCLMDGADEYLQLMALFTTMMREICR